MNNQPSPQPSPIGEGGQPSRPFGDTGDHWAPLDYPGGLLDGLWQRSTWRGLEKLACVQCHWDTLNGLEAAREHAQICSRCHPKQPADSPSPILVADKRGNIKEA
jgi:hypothetical protein